MGAIAKRLVLRQPAAAQPYRRTPAQTELRTLLIENFEFAFNSYGTVVINRNFRSSHEFRVYPAYSATQVLRNSPRPWTVTTTSSPGFSHLGGL